MATITDKLRSDLTGKEDTKDKFIELVVREAPGLENPVRLDILPSEIKNLQDAGEYVVLEVKDNGSTRQIITSAEEFNKLAPNMREVLANAPGIRGRKPGWSPKG